MKKQKTKFVLAEATLDEVNRQLKINAFIIALLVVILSRNIMIFIRESSFFYGFLIAVMFLLLFLIIKGRRLLKTRKQALVK
ncbi:hypothetical protein [Psychrobacter jeotgali]|uniref:hypothetical protein n=1 Tax=Psychrobacter jeotgali TaxID=179010 RepID=UPI00191B0CC4|nr:hypothetical protein [Psychrobacter jeotgali]